MLNGGEEGKARMDGGGHDKEAASSKFNVSVYIQKSIPCLWPKRLKNPTLWGRTYLYSRYKGVPPPERRPRSLNSSHPSHVKNFIPFSQFLRLRRLCSDDSDFSNRSKEMCQFFEKRGYPASVIQMAHHRAQQTDRQSAPQTSQKQKN